MTAQELRDCVASNLKARRAERNLTQRQLAKLVDVTQAQIAQIESGSSAPSIDLLARLGKALGTEPHAFLSPGIFSEIDA